MKLTFCSVAGIACMGSLLLGCAARTAPFDKMDQAQITVMKLQGTPAPAPVPAAVPGQQPALIPGIPPELQQLGQQAVQGLQGLLPPGMIPPGLLPGQQTPVVPQAPSQPKFKDWVILAPPMQLTDEEIREEILDIFGDEGSFSADRGNCFSPGMGISMLSPESPTPVDLMISLSCNQAQMDGFKWPYPGINGFTTDTRQRLSKVYEKLFGPVPPDA